MPSARSDPRAIAACATLVMLLGGACASDDATSPVETDASFQSVVATQVQKWRPLKDNLPPLKIDLPDEPRPWDSDPDALKAVVASVDGLVAIGLKPPGANRTSQTGIVPGISRGIFESAVGGLLGKGVVVLETFRNFPLVVAVIDPESIPNLLARPSVDYIEPLIPRPTASEDTTWGTVKIGAPVAWALGDTGSGANIWILDTGVDSVHANDSLVGDWNTYNARCGWATPRYSDCYDDAQNGFGHGALVHSVAVAAANDTGYVGVAYGVSGNTMIRVCNYNSQYQKDECHVGAIVGAVDSAIATGDPRTIINMSYAGAYSSAEATAMTSAWNAGILLVAGAGQNYGPIQYPAKLSQVIAVTGTTESDGFVDQAAYQDCGYSNSGSEAELSAPYRQSGMGHDGSYHDNVCGTSFASPAVAGVAALVWGKYPTMTASQVRNRLTSTAKDLGATGRDSYFGYGRVDACRAVGCDVDFTLDGDDELEVDEDGTWSVDAIVGGAGPYTYQWYKNNVLQTGETGSSYTTSFPDEDWHNVSVEVTPAIGLPGSDDMYVNVKSCEEEWCGE